MEIAKICNYSNNKDVIIMKVYSAGYLDSDCHSEREYFMDYENALKHLEKLKAEQETNDDIFRIDSKPREIIFSDNKYEK